MFRTLLERLRRFRRLWRASVAFDVPTASAGVDTSVTAIGGRVCGHIKQRVRALTPDRSGERVLEAATPRECANLIIEARLLGRLETLVWEQLEGDRWCERDRYTPSTS